MSVGKPSYHKMWVILHTNQHVESFMTWNILHANDCGGLPTMITMKNHPQ